MDYSLLPSPLRSVIEEWLSKEPYAETKQKPFVLVSLRNPGNYLMIFQMGEILRFDVFPHIVERLGTDNIPVFSNRKYEVVIDPFGTEDYQAIADDLRSKLEELDEEYYDTIHKVDEYLGKQINQL